MRETELDCNVWHRHHCLPKDTLQEAGRPMTNYGISDLSWLWSQEGLMVWGTFKACSRLGFNYYLKSFWLCNWAWLSLPGAMEPIDEFEKLKDPWPKIERPMSAHDWVHGVCKKRDKDDWLMRFLHLIWSAHWTKSSMSQLEWRAL